MAGIMNVGYVAKPGEDIFPSTGPHLDVRVLKDGKYIDPSTWRSGLQQLKIGPGKTPLYSQKGDQWVSGFPVTSGYGARVAPTAGASTFHPAIDYGVPGGTQLSWEGPGTFKPGQGYGSILTPEGYEVRLLHTKGGQQTNVPGSIAGAPPTQQQQTGTAASPQVTYNIYLKQPIDQQQQVTPQSMLKQFISERLTSPKNYSPTDIYKALAAAATNPDVNLEDLT